MTEQFTWTFDEDAARAWLTAEAAKEDVFEYYLEDTFSPRDVGSEGSIHEIVELAQQEKWLTCTANDRFPKGDYPRNRAWVDLEGGNGEGSFLAWYCEFAVPVEGDIIRYAALTLFAGGSEPWKVGDPDATGIDGVMSVLEDTARYLESATRTFHQFVAAWQRTA